MKASVILALLALSSTAALAEPRYDPSRDAFSEEAFDGAPESGYARPPGPVVNYAAGLLAPYDGASDDRPVTHRPSLDYGTFGKGNYAQPSFRTPDTTTLQTDYRGRTTFTVLPPPAAYHDRCPGSVAAQEPRPTRDARGRKRTPRIVHRAYEYRVVNGFAKLVPPPCERIVGILAPAY